MGSNIYDPVRNLVVNQVRSLASGYYTERRNKQMADIRGERERLAVKLAELEAEAATEAVELNKLLQFLGVASVDELGLDDD